MFSLISNAKVPPLVPIPAPALISPVGFSSTSTSITLRSSLDPGKISDLTDKNIFLDFSFAIDLSKFKLVNGSPSSISSSLLITFSLVTLFPFILILSTRIFLPSIILNTRFILSFSRVSATLCSTNCKLFLSINLSISSSTFFTLFGE